MFQVTDFKQQWYNYWIDENGLNYHLHEYEEIGTQSNGSGDGYMAGALAISGALLADDVSGVGVVDDIAIPFLIGAALLLESLDDRLDLGQQIDLRIIFLLRLKDLIPKHQINSQVRL